MLDNAGFYGTLLLMATTFIYALCEPGTRTVRYIGKSVRLSARYREHLRVSARKKTHLGFWLRSLLSPPEVVVLRKVETSGFAEEIHYIDLARRLGMRLVNSTDGGEGITMTPEIREKISRANMGHTVSESAKAKTRAANLGSKRSEEVKAHLSAIRKGRPWTPARYAAHKKNKPRSAKQLAVILAVNARKKGVKLSPEHCAKISAGITGDKNPFFGRKHTEETKAKISAARTNS